MLHSLWRQSVWQSVSGNTTWNVESETETSGGRWPLVFGFARWFFEFRGRGCEFGFETNVEILHVWRTRWSRRSIFVIQFSPFSFFVLRLRNLEANFKFQRASCSKKEDEEACQSVTKRVGKNDFSSLKLKGWESHCCYFVVLLVQSWCHGVNDCSFDWYCDR